MKRKRLLNCLIYLINFNNLKRKKQTSGSSCTVFSCWLSSFQVSTFNTLSLFDRSTFPLCPTTPSLSNFFCLLIYFRSCQSPNQFFLCLYVFFFFFLLLTERIKKKKTPLTLNFNRSIKILGFFVFFSSFHLIGA